MGKSAKDVANEIHQALLKSGNSVMTIPNEDLYTISGRERIRGSFLDQVRTELETIGHIFASGDKVHIVSQDTNHSPKKS